MSRQICNSTEHLFTPILEVSIPLLRCVRCNVYAYHETVKQLAKNRAYKADMRNPDRFRSPFRTGDGCGSVCDERFALHR